VAEDKGGLWIRQMDLDWIVDGCTLSTKITPSSVLFRLIFHFKEGRGL